MIRRLPTCTCGSSSPGAHGPGCPRATLCCILVRPARIIRTGAGTARTQSVTFDAAEAATAWIAELRTAQAAREARP